MRLWLPVLLTAGVLSAAPAPICDAIRNNRLSDLKAQIAVLKDINEPVCWGNTALHLAAVSGTVDALKLLLEAGANPSAKSVADATPLMFSVSEKEKVRLLLEAGADPNARSKSGRTAFLVASMNPGSLDVLKMLVAKGAEPKAEDARGMNALVGAAFARDLGMTKYVLDLGVKEKQDSEFGCALGAAAPWGDLELVKLLIANGGDPHCVNRFGGKVKHGEIELKLLTPLMVAVPYGGLKVAQALIDAGANVNAVDSRGMTALMLSVVSDRHDPAVTKLLLAKGAKTDLKDKYGATALDWAKRTGNPETIKLLGGIPQKPELAPVKQLSADTREVVEKSFGLLTRTSTEFFKQSGCPACHHINLTAVATEHLRNVGYAIDEKAFSDLMKVTRGRFTRGEQLFMLRQEFGGGVDTLGYAGMAMAADRVEPDVVTDSMVANVAMQQQADGSWPYAAIPRPPMEDSTIHRTALAIRLISLYGPPARKPEWDARIAKARNWLARAKPNSTDERVMQIEGLKWAGASTAELQPHAKALAATQRKDGGWAQNKWLASDAMGTGQAVFALAQAGYAADHPARAKGRSFLISTQNEDGSWMVRSRSPKFQPYFESGFPYGHDQWISHAASTWATMALASR
ncbi:MAG TPA: ankyrin repeat domain-containing protein [Bryobacteraceae bacterium]|nr:ankyrin repeat domain-containing protein [Bryobacteraceae bacterium]